MIVMITPWGLLPEGTNIESLARGPLGWLVLQDISDQDMNVKKKKKKKTPILAYKKWINQMVKEVH